MTRHEAIYAAWYIVLFAIVVGWAAFRTPAPASLETVSDGTYGHEPEGRRAALRTVR